MIYIFFRRYRVAAEHTVLELEPHLQLATRYSPLLFSEMMMSKDRLILGTRKGLIILKQNGSDWGLTHSTFPGIPISYAIGRCA